jgi:IS4 transposase
MSADKTQGVKSNQAITLKNFYPKQKYPERLRRIHYFDSTTQKRLIFLTNNFRLSALTIANLYRCRWQVELFFRWIKQHLRIKAFYGTSENAVKTQIWIAISIYVLVAIVKKRLDLDRSLHSILQILSLSLMEKIPISQSLSGADDIEQKDDFCNQLNLFN